MHEIGHYLEQCLGFKQNFEGYQNPFAEKLLLLENDYKEGDKVFVPETLRGYFRSFLYDLSRKYKVPNVFSKRDLFVYWQLYSRWEKKEEISNILGVYFEKDSKTIYINTLSDIQRLQPIQYGHNCGSIAYRQFKYSMENGRRSHELNKFRQEDGINLMEDAFSKRPDTKILHLLCKLHKREFVEDFINFADVDSEEDIAKVKDRFGECKSSDVMLQE